MGTGQKQAEIGKNPLPLNSISESQKQLIIKEECGRILEEVEGKILNYSEQQRELFSSFALCADSAWDLILLMPLVN